MNQGGHSSRVATALIQEQSGQPAAPAGGTLTHAHFAGLDPADELTPSSGRDRNPGAVSVHAVSHQHIPRGPGPHFNALSYAGAVTALAKGNTTYGEYGECDEYGESGESPHFYPCSLLSDLARYLRGEGDRFFRSESKFD